ECVVARMTVNAQWAARRLHVKRVVADISSQNHGLAGESRVDVERVVCGAAEQRETCSERRAVKAYVKRWRAGHRGGGDCVGVGPDGLLVVETVVDEHRVERAAVVDV